MVDCLPTYTIQFLIQPAENFQNIVKQDVFVKY